MILLFKKFRMGAETGKPEYSRFLDLINQQ